MTGSVSGLTVRDARRGDVPALVALLADDALGSGRESAEGPVPESYYAAFDAMAATPLVRMLVAAEGGDIVGCMQLNLIPHLSMRGGTRAQLQSMRIRRDRRGEGLGAAFVRQAAEIAREAGCILMELTTDNGRPDAHRFYERLGFRTTHRGMKLRLD